VGELWCTDPVRFQFAGLGNAAQPIHEEKSRLAETWGDPGLEAEMTREYPLVNIQKAIENGHL